MNQLSRYRAVWRILTLALFCGPAAAALQIEPFVEVCPGPCSGVDDSADRSFITAGGKLFFRSGNVARNVWVTDGSPQGTVELQGAIPGAVYMQHTPLVRVGDRVYFGSSTEGEGWRVFESDGTPAGTRHVPMQQDQPLGLDPANAITDWGGEAWFERGGTIFRVAAAGANAEPMAKLFVRFTYDPMVPRAGSLFVAGSICRNCIERVWRIERNGTLAAVEGLPSATLAAVYDGPGGVIAHFQHDGGSFPNEIWRIADDGSIASIRTSASPLTFSANGMHEGRFWFSDVPNGEGAQLYSTDGTKSGTRKETALPTPVNGANAMGLTTFRGQRFASARVGAPSSYGTFARLDKTHPQGARQVRRLSPGGGPPRAKSLIVYADRMFFSVYTGDRYELWVSDGTSGGTQQVPVPQTTEPWGQSDAPIAVLGEWLYFSRRTRDNGAELWRLRGLPSDFKGRSTQNVVEYYNAPLDHYFMTGRPDEIAILDAGNVPDWRRTGQGFTTYAPDGGEPSAVPVCRFYGLASAGLNTHFYTAFSEECNYVVEHFSGAWLLETRSIFEVVRPESDGECPLGYGPLYRTFNQRTDINHRYTTDLQVQSAMAAKGWKREGYGLGVSMCVLASDTVQ